MPETKRKKAVRRKRRTAALTATKSSDRRLDLEQDDEAFAEGGGVAGARRELPLADRLFELAFQLRVVDRGQADRLRAAGLIEGEFDVDRRASEAEREVGGLDDDDGRELRRTGRSRLGLILVGIGERGGREGNAGEGGSEEEGFHVERED